MEIICDNFKEILSYCLKLSPKSVELWIFLFISTSKDIFLLTLVVQKLLHQSCTKNVQILTLLAVAFTFISSYSICICNFYNIVFSEKLQFCKLLKNWIWQSADASKSTRYLQLKVSPLFQFFSFFFKQKVYHHICLFYDTLA